MKYRAKEGFELKDLAGELILLPRGASTVDYNYVMVFNETGALIYRAMSDYTEPETLAALLVEKYSIPEDMAKDDTMEYINKMLEAGIIEEE